MNNTTKLCITVIIVALIWFFAQPIGGNISISANLDHVPYLNLTNSNVSGSAEISGHMPIGFMLPMFIAEVVSYLPDNVIVFILSTTIAILLYILIRRK